MNGWSLGLGNVWDASGDVTFWSDETPERSVRLRAGELLALGDRIHRVERIDEPPGRPGTMQLRCVRDPGALAAAPPRRYAPIPYGVEQSMAGVRRAVPAGAGSWIEAAGEIDGWLLCLEVTTCLGDREWELRVRVPLDLSEVIRIPAPAPDRLRVDPAAKWLFLSPERTAAGRARAWRIRDWSPEEAPDREPRDAVPLLSVLTPCGWPD